MCSSKGVHTHGMLFAPLVKKCGLDARGQLHYRMQETALGHPREPGSATGRRKLRIERAVLDHRSSVTPLSQDGADKASRRSEPADSIPPGTVRRTSCTGARRTPGSLHRYWGSRSPWRRTRLPMHGLCKGTSLHTKRVTPTVTPFLVS